MVNVRLDDSWELRSDSHNWTLAKDEKACWFFTSLECALRSYLDLKLRGCDAQSINTLILQQKAIVEALNRAISPLEIVIAPEKVEVKDGK